jgi:hypothetical protein
MKTQLGARIESPCFDSSFGDCAYRESGGLFLRFSQNQFKLGRGKRRIFTVSGDNDLVREARAVVLVGLLVAITYFFAAGQQKLHKPEGLIKSRPLLTLGNPKPGC